MQKIIGLHNGIIVNQNYQIQSNEKLNYEGYKVKSDSLVLFESLSDLFSKNKDKFLEELEEFQNNIEGNYSIYLRVPEKKVNILSSNCGSLYYLMNENYLIYASEKVILKKFLVKSNLKFNFGEEKIKKLLNEKLIFNDELKKITKETLKKEFFY